MEFESDIKLQRLKNEGYYFNPSSTISDGWQLAKKDLGALVVYNLIVLILYAAFGRMPSLLRILVLAFSGPISAGGYYYLYRMDMGLSRQPSDFLEGFRKFTPLFVVSLLTGLAITLGFALLIIPGIWLSVALQFALPLVLFRNYEAISAMKASVHVINKAWFSFFGFVILLALLNIAGAICLGVGLLITIPITQASLYLAYQKIIGTDLS